MSELQSSPYETNFTSLHYKVVPPGCAFYIDDLFPKYASNESDLFMTLFGEPGHSASFAKLRTGIDRGSNGRFCSFAPWEPGYPEFQDEQWAAMETDIE